MLKNRNKSIYYSLEKQLENSIGGYPIWPLNHWSARVVKGRKGRVFNPKATVRKNQTASTPAQFRIAAVTHRVPRSGDVRGIADPSTIVGVLPRKTANTKPPPKSRNYTTPSNFLRRQTEYKKTANHIGLTVFTAYFCLTILKESTPGIMARLPLSGGNHFPCNCNWSSTYSTWNLAP